MLPGFRLRQVRERLGLTYRDVERASFELAARRGRPEFVVHISRLADIENRSVVPGMHKLYTLSVVYHLSPLEILRWYEVPLDEFFVDGTMFAETYAEVLKKYPGAVEVERIVFVRGKIDRKRETPSLLINEVLPIADALPKLTTTVALKLDGARHNIDQTANLRGNIPLRPREIPSVQQADRELRAGGDPKLGVDVGQMVLNGLGAHD